MHARHRAAQGAIAGGLLVLVVLTLWGRPWSTTSELVLDVGVAVVALALVPLLLRRPVMAGLFLGGLAAVSPLATPAATAAVFLVARYRPFRVSAGVALVGVGGHLLLNLWRPREGLSYGWWAFVVVVAYATLVGWGAYVRARAELLDSLRERARRAEAEQAWRVAEARSGERARIAREMHDVLAHRLSLVATHAGALEFRPDASPEQVAVAAGVVRSGVHQALAELREVISVLRDADEPMDPGERLPVPPQPTLADLPRLLDDNAAAGARIEVRDLADAVARVPTTPSRTAYRILHAGASGYLLKDTPPPQIVEAIRRVAAGEPMLSPRIIRRLMDRTAEVAGARLSASATLGRLTERESEVMLAVARGAANAEIAAELFMSVATVKAHVSRILAKLELSNRTQLALLAHQAGLV